MNGVLMRRAGEDIDTHGGKTQRGHREKAAIYKPRRQASGEKKALTPWASGLQNCKKITAV